MEKVKWIAGSLGLEKTYFELWWKYRCHFVPKTAWNDANETFFIHIPKTAGTSLFTSLEMEKVSYTHIPARVLRHLYPNEYKRFYSFAIVRNPWDRFVSLYEFLKSGTYWDEQKDWAQKHIGEKTFEEFVEKIDKNFAFRTSVMSDNFFFPQSYFVTDKKNNVIVEDIFRFEELADAFKQLNARFGLNAPLTHERKTTSRKPYQSYYSEKSKKIVGELYKSDVDIFNYRF